MRYGLLLALVGSFFLTMTPIAQADVKDFCAQRWHGIEAMQQYCLEAQKQSFERLAQLLDVLDTTHAQMKISNGNTTTSVATQCSRQHHLKVFDIYHNQLVEGCLIQYLNQLQYTQRMYQQQHAQLDEF